MRIEPSRFSSWIVVEKASGASPMAIAVVASAVLAASSVTRKITVRAVSAAKAERSSVTMSPTGTTVWKLAPPSVDTSMSVMSSSTPTSANSTEPSPAGAMVAASGAAARSPPSSAVVSGSGIGPVPASVISIRSTLGPVFAPAGIASEIVLLPATSVTVVVSKSQ